MTSQTRAITIHTIPKRIDASQERRFLDELQVHVNTERPRLVLDCSQIESMDEAMMHLLLCCLEEGMKRNGDVKLAALSREAENVVRSAGLHKLFEIHPTKAAALKSFHSYLEPNVFSIQMVDAEAAKSESAA